MTIVAVIGAVTLLIAGFSALVQHDIKRVLAYSTISQIGYMFLALGVGAWSAAIFHFMVHAFFKSLLFLCAGVVITAMGGEHDIFKMGGLRKRLPSDILGVPDWLCIAVGFAFGYSGLLQQGYDSLAGMVFSIGRACALGAGLVGALITSLYAFRVLFIVFFGESKTEINYRPALRMSLVLVILAILSIAGGFIELPHIAGAIASIETNHQTQYVFETIAGVTSVAGIFLAYVLFAGRRQFVSSLLDSKLCVEITRLVVCRLGFRLALSQSARSSLSMACIYKQG